MPPLVDTFGRAVRKIRLSVTDRCNFRCAYCLPDEPTWLPRTDILTFEELERLVKIVAPLGVSRVRLTGGEPLLRKDLHQLVARLVAIPGVERVAMTTNGYHLAERAKALHEAGLSSVTVSLDALEAASFDALVKRPAFTRVMAGIDAARAVGFSPIKINVVILRGRNEDQILRFAEMARSGPFTVRFIEFMPLDSGGKWDMSQVVRGDDIRARIAAEWPLDPLVHDPHDPARAHAFRDGRGEVGFISSVTEPFCGSCDRIRLTADGKILNCLFGTVEYDVRAALRSSSSDDEVLAVIRRAIHEKERGHLINQPGFEKPARTMVAIGG